MRVQAAALLIALILALLAIIFAVSGVAAPPGAASRLPTDTPLTSFLPALGGAPRRRRDTVRYGLVTGAALLCNTMHALFFHHVARSLHWRKTRRRLEATESASFFDLCVGMLLATQDTELTQNHSGWKANELLNRGRLGRATLSRGGGAFRLHTFPLPR